MSNELRPLTLEQQATLKSLRREVDDLQEELARATRAELNTQSRLFRARERLREFTQGLRKDGYLI